MAKFLNSDVYIQIDGNDISDHCFNIETMSERERIDVSGFNSTGAKSFLAGSKEDSIKFSVLQDFGASSIHDILFWLYNNQSTFVVNVRPTSSSTSATNPELTGNAKIYSYGGLNGGLGERSEIEVELYPADSSGFTWVNT